MNDPLIIKYKYNSIIFEVDPYYNPLPFMIEIESPITGEPTPPDDPGW